MATIVLRCTCQHSYQDRRYGDGMRLHNGCSSSANTGMGWRCTVCGNKQDVKAAYHREDEEKE